MSNAIPVVSGKEYVLGFAFYGPKVLLIRKARPEWMRGKLNGLGGHRETGETFPQAMVREFHEEARVETVTADWTRRLDFYCGCGGVTNYIAVYAARLDIGHIPRGNGDEPVLLAAAFALPSDVLPNLRWMIPLILDGDLGRQQIVEASCIPSGETNSQAGAL